MIDVAKLCKFCKSMEGKEVFATRVTHFCSLDVSHLDIWSRIMRKTRSNCYTKEPVCEKHYFMFHHGLETLECGKCGGKFLVDVDDYYNIESFKCAMCGADI